MARPIAPTPVLTGKSAIAMARYMKASADSRGKIVIPSLDMDDIAKAITAMKAARRKIS